MIFSVIYKLSFPYSIGREYADYPIWVMVIVTDLAIKGLELFDPFDVFEAHYSIL